MPEVTYRGASLHQANAPGGFDTEVSLAATMAHFEQLSHLVTQSEGLGYEQPENEPVQYNERHCSSDTHGAAKVPVEHCSPNMGTISNSATVMECHRGQEKNVSGTDGTTVKSVQERGSEAAELIGLSGPTLMVYEDRVGLDVDGQGNADFCLTSAVVFTDTFRLTHCYLYCFLPQSAHAVLIWEINHFGNNSIPSFTVSAARTILPIKWALQRRREAKPQN